MFYNDLLCIDKPETIEDVGKELKFSNEEEKNA
jgi:hypothetical protein